jgi:hypothetical protein
MCATRDLPERRVRLLANQLRSAKRVVRDDFGWLWRHNQLRHLPST